MSATPVFFSVSSAFILTGEPLAYDLYINSSSLEERRRFVRVFPAGEFLAAEDLERMVGKYRQFYVPESQREAYFETLVRHEGLTEQQRTEAVKTSAIHYLDQLFAPDKEFSTEMLGEAVRGCRDTVSGLVTLLHDHDVLSLQELIGSLSYHDFYTYDHSINVAMYNILLYEVLDPEADSKKVTLAGLAGMLHDLGKIRLPLSILNNAGELTEEEIAEIRAHPAYGVRIMKDSKAQLPGDIDLVSLLSVIYEHHENFDGSGYPRGLKGDQIHLLARVTAVCDFFDAVTTKRAYHEPLSATEALKLMEASVGKKLDPRVFKLFAAQVKSYRPSLKTGRKLPESFDPCQPHEKLPFEAVRAEPAREDFGGIKVVGKKEEVQIWEGKKGVKVIEEKTRPASKRKDRKG